MSARKLPKFTAVEHPLLDRPYLIPSNLTNFIENLKFESMPGDVFLCTYPKCGTSWTITALYMMRNGGKSLAPGENLDELVPSIEYRGNASMDSFKERPRLIRTHLYLELVQWNPDAKYIVVARNPKDCFVSFYYHTLGFPYFEFTDGLFEDYFELILKGEVSFGDYFKYLSDWFERSKTHSNVLFILYEDMKEDVVREYLKIAEFLGGEWLEKAKANDCQLLKKIKEASSFKTMIKMHHQYCKSKRPDHLPFFRKGIIGDWKNHFTKEQSHRVDEKMKEYGKICPGFDHIWDKYSQYLSF